MALNEEIRTKRAAGNTQAELQLLEVRRTFREKLGLTPVPKPNEAVTDLSGEIGQKLDTEVPAELMETIRQRCAGAGVRDLILVKLV